ncbi:SH3 domain-containing protein [Amaricoccus solimangrovi]|uniref:SH3 domain-containing protein n=1 Tax=Amaricoccus solimangrovi TaxID=2589815 RepID=A0A501W6A5_9RHOB|nr:SH3 domain-containing protein [Amaricoccus solimangrovi]TPE44165.1 SH3 domain-containing protein [Amaricoccus solimangrovi]
MTTLFLVAMLALGFGVASADEVRRERVRFPAGTTGTTVSGNIKGYDSVEYQVGATAGQEMTASLRVDNPVAYFNVFGPGDVPGKSTALFIGSSEGDDFRRSLDESGDYTIQVFIMRAGARRGETASYALRIGITGASPAVADPTSDYADGLAGGPDFWELAGLAAGDTLNLRSGPSTHAAVLARLPTGTVLRNRGCRMAGGQRWCEVERTGDETRGWVAGRYLREAGAAAYAAQAETGDALVPGTAFNATGSLPCASTAGEPMGECPFGVIRRGGGTATVTITLPDGRTRSIEFENGNAVSADVSAADGEKHLGASREADLNLIRIGEERYEVPDVVVSGD